MMTKAVIEEAGLVIKRGPRLGLISLTGHIWPFLGLFEEIEVAIVGLKTR